MYNLLELHVFVTFSTARNADILKRVKDYVVQNSVVQGDNSVTDFDDSFLREHVKSVSIADSKLAPHEVSFCSSLYSSCKGCDTLYTLHVYTEGHEEWGIYKKKYYLPKYTV